MNSDTGEMVNMVELAEKLGIPIVDRIEESKKEGERLLKEVELSTKKIQEIQEAAVEKGYVMWQMGEQVEIKNCKFKVVYIQTGKNRITLEGIPKEKL